MNDREAKWAFQWRQLAVVTPIVLIFSAAYFSGLLYNALVLWLVLVSRISDSSHNSRAGHPSSTPTRVPRWGPRAWRRCSSLT
jgi:hypothetical protein